MKTFSTLNTLRAIPFLQPTRKSYEVACLWREPNIFTGFRIPYKSWTYYTLSLFQVHNESGNVWSHLIAFLVFLYKTLSYGIYTDFYSREYTWGLLAFGVSISLYAFLSFTAHLFQSKNESVHYFCWLIDYIGIGIYGWGMGTMLYYCSGTETVHAFFGRYFLAINSVLSVGACIGSGAAKLMYRRPYPAQRKMLQLLASGLHVVFLMTPAYIKFYECFVQHGAENCFMEKLYHHTSYAGWFLASIFFFASHWPEKLMPGHFDLVGHGHQLFHIFVAIASVYQFDAGRTDLLLRSNAAVNHDPDGMELVTAFCFVIICDIMFILSMLPNIRKRVREDIEVSKMS